MDITFTPYKLVCTHPFGISRSTHEWYEIIYLYVEQDGIIGRGEAAPSERYQESADQIKAVLESGIRFPDISADPSHYQNKITEISHGLKALEAALDMALWDWWGKRQQVPVYKLFGSDEDHTPVTSFTIALGNFDLIPKKIEEAAPYKILKVKLGTDKDREIIREIRKFTNKTIRVDANEGWTLDTALIMVHWLADQGVELIEQPFPARNLSDTARLRDQAPIPIIADENCLTGADIPRIADSFHGINIKLMKCGGLTEARSMISMARKRDLKIMVGCMIESSVGISAMAALSPQIDFADLDGNVLINNDPYAGVTIEDGRLELPPGNGLGVTLRSGVAQESGLR
ncbi:MAG: dipeptide epimerase [FCB group bacterium]|nr:dipeptide epimerase [FCB group bacterium]